MKSKQSITASVALAALASAWLAKYWRSVNRRELKHDEKCQQEALNTFEGEGGLVLA